MVGESQHATLGAMKSVNLPIRFNQAAREQVCAPPLLGQHTRDILRQAHYSPDEIDALLAGRVVATHD
ncbi:formyl-coenzyme A transferase [compost metagenome]